MSPELLLPEAARAARDLALIDEIAGVLRLAAPRITGLVARCASVAIAADWSAPSARAYGERADELRRSFAHAEGMADDAAVVLERIRAEVAARGGV